MNKIKTEKKKKKKILINSNVLQEVKDLLIDEEPKKIRAENKIVYDEKHSKQYSVKIPKKIAELVEINHKADVIVFEVTIPEKHNEKPMLILTYERK